MAGIYSVHTTLVNCIGCICRSKDDGAFNRESSAVIKLNQTVMYLRGVTKYLSLVCLLREDSFKKQGKGLSEKVTKYLALVFYPQRTALKNKVSAYRPKAR